MKKKSFLQASLAILAGVVLVVFIAVYLAGRGDEPPLSEEEKKEAVNKIVGSRTATPGTGALAPLEFEMIPVPEELGAPEGYLEAKAKARKQLAAKVREDQVLAIINGMPLTARQLIPPGRFKKDGTLVLPAKALEEVLERSIARELIFQESETEGVELSDRAMTELEKQYGHLTGNPLILPEGQTVKDLNVWGGEEDAAFHVRDHAAFFLQSEFLKEGGAEDTAEARLEFRKWLRSNADVEIVETQPAGL